MANLMELILILTKETHNSYWDIMKMEFHYAHGLYKTYERLSEEAKKNADKENQTNNTMPALPMNMPNMQNINSQISNMMSNLKAPKL